MSERFAATARSHRVESKCGTEGRTTPAGQCKAKRPTAIGPPD
jgi:hypothetical protein